MDNVFDLEAFFVQNGDDTIARLEGRISIPMTQRLSAAEMEKAMKGENGIIARMEDTVGEQFKSAVRVWPDSYRLRDDGVIFNFRMTIMDFNGFDGLRKAIRDAWKGVTPKG